MCVCVFEKYSIGEVQRKMLTIFWYDWMTNIYYEELNYGIDEYMRPSANVIQGGIREPFK